MKTLITLLILATVPAFAADDLNSEHVLLAYLKVKPGKESDFLKASEKVILLSRKEPGNIRYVLQESVNEPEQFVFFEQFKSDAALELHRKSAHVIEFLDQIKPILVPNEFKLVKYNNVH